MEQLCYFEDPKDVPVEADAILLKESGLSGGFQEKVDAAKAKGMRILVLKRPETPAAFRTVNGPYGLRRAVEKLLPAFYPLHSGLTTGTCATAAAIAATIRLLKNETPEEVPILLPDGETIHVAVGYGEGYAYCIKDAGDDPDVTNGLEIRASVKPTDTFEILGGEGVGTFTLPGFDYPPGSPAINKAPREMIRQNIAAITNNPLNITISVPEGEAIAKKTGMNYKQLHNARRPFFRMVILSHSAYSADGQKCYLINVGGEPQSHCGSVSEAQYSTDVLDIIRSLINFEHAPKDNRIGKIIYSCLEKGTVTVDDYMKYGAEKKINLISQNSK